MTRVNLDFEVDGEQQLSRFFDQVGEIIGNYQAIFEAWGDDFRQTQEQVFASSGAFEGGGQWQQLSPKYREWKDFNYPGRPILTRTGRLRSSLTQEGHAEHHHDYTEDQMEIGTVIDEPPYPLFHQRGTYKMPQRKVIQLTDPQKKRWVDIARQVTWDELQGLSEPTIGI